MSHQLTFKNLGKKWGQWTGVACLAILLKPAPGFAQPGRSFTPPPPPPPPPPPRVFTPPPPPINHQQNMQHFQQMAAQRMDQFRMSNQRDFIKTQLDANAIQRATNPTFLLPRADAAPVAHAAPAVRDLPRVQITVLKVDPNGLGAKLGLMEGDVVVSYDGKPLKGTQHLQDLATRGPIRNRNVELVVIRNDVVLQLDVRPGRLGLSVTAVKAIP